MELFEPLSQRQTWIQRIIGGVLIIGVLLCTIQPSIHLIKSWAKFAPQLTFLYWLIGLVFLVLQKPRLTMVAFVCSGFLCLFLKDTTSSEDNRPLKNNTPTLRVAQINIAASNSSAEGTLQTIQNTLADVISIQEVSLNWHNTLKDSLKKMYPHHCRVEGSDLLGIELYAKQPFITCDTFYSHELPNIGISLQIIGMKMPVHLISSFIKPPHFSSAYYKMQEQLLSIAGRVRQINAPVLTVGDYNIEASSSEIQIFRREAGLLESRRGFRPYRPDSKFDISEVPTDHIFFTPHLQCTHFETVSGFQSEKIGIVGTYQMLEDSAYVKKKN